jgi:hypothetical protein
MCPACIEQDLQQAGWAYWHGQHQYPGVWECPIHRQLLLVARPPSPVSPAYALPHQIALDIASGSDNVEPSPRLHELTALIIGLVEHEVPIERRRLPTLYQDRLIRLGLVKSAEGDDYPSLAVDFMNHVCQFHGLLELHYLPETVQT